METIECSSCHRKFDDETLLSLHHEYEPCFNGSSSSSSLDCSFICPICDRIFADPLVLQIHVNEDHDQTSVHNNTTTASDRLYAQDVERRERMKRRYEQQKADDMTGEDDPQEDEDAIIARMLQDEEDAKSFEEFQNRYGASNRTFQDRAKWNLENIYKKKFISKAKYEEYKSRLEDMIAQPIETNESRSTGIIQLIERLPMGALIDRRLCRPGCDHISGTWLDQGWACGYKNFQMLLSSLRRDPQYAKHLFGHEATNQINRDIPSVSYLQNLIEKAWAAGFDSEGREQLNGSLVNSTKWIGPTEIMACLAFLNIKTELYDFHKPKNLNNSNAYKYLFEWIRAYFQEKQENGNRIIHPLYLQHEGHSRTIVGYEQFRNGNLRLLIFDPSTSKFTVNKFCNNPDDQAHIFRRSLQSFQKPVYQVLVICGFYDSTDREAGKKLRSIKVPPPDT